MCAFSVFLFMGVGESGWAYGCVGVGGWVVEREGDLEEGEREGDGWWVDGQVEGNE